MDIEDTASQFKQKGNDEFKKGNYAKAIQFYTSAIDRREDPAFYSNRAACYLKIKKYNNCISDCKRLLTLDPKFAKGYVRKGQGEMAIGKVEDAVQSFRKANELEKGDATIKKSLEDAELAAAYDQDILKLESEDNFVDAIRKAEMILELCPEYNNMHLKHIELMNKKGDIEKSIKKCQELGHTLGNNSKLGFLRGQAYYYSGKTDAGKKIWKEVLNMDPDMMQCAIGIRNSKKAEDLKEKGNTAFKAQKIDEALKIYEECIALDPWNRKFNSLALGNITSCYIKKDDNKMALKSINKAIDYDDKYAKGYFKRAELYKKLQDWESCERDYRRAQALDSTLNLEGLIKDNMKKVKEAKKKDYYSILGVGKDATDSEIKKAFRKLSLQWHPDKHADENEDEKTIATKKYKDIVDAYDVLKDPKKRKQFDMGVYDDGTGGGSQGFETFSMDDLMGGMGGGGNPLFQMFFGPGSMNNFDFGPGGGHQKQQKRGSQGGQQFFQSQGFPGGQGGGMKFSF